MSNFPCDDCPYEYQCTELDLEDCDKKKPDDTEK